MQKPNFPRCYVQVPCLKCGGQGRLIGYEHVEGGICFRCEGRRGAKEDILHPEWSAYDAHKRAQAKARKAAKVRAKAIADHGPWLVGLALAGQGDYFAVSIISQVLAGRDLSQKQAAACLKLGLKAQAAVNAPPPYVPQHVGQVKQRLVFDAIFERFTSWDGFYGWTALYIFRTEAGDLLVWKTSKALSNLRRGDRVAIKATIKGHSEYNGRAQTEITRAVVEPA